MESLSFDLVSFSAQQKVITINRRATELIALFLSYHAEQFLHSLFVCHSAWHYRLSPRGTFWYAYLPCVVLISLGGAKCATSYYNACKGYPLGTSWSSGDVSHSFIFAANSKMDIPLSAHIS